MARERVAFITGTSTGFGHHIARGLRADGYAVFATMRHSDDRNRAPREELEREGIVVLDVDVTDDASVDVAAHAVLRDGGRIDLVVNNAGTAHMGVTEAFTPASLERQFATNVVGSARVARAFLPAMRDAGEGLIVFVSSVVGRFVLPFTGVYAGSKFAIEAYAESLSFELRPAGVDIAIVEPGAYATNILITSFRPTIRHGPRRMARRCATSRRWDRRWAPPRAIPLRSQPRFARSLRCRQANARYVRWFRETRRRLRSTPPSRRSSAASSMRMG